MKYRNLGATGLQVSEIGFGGWGIGGTKGNVPAYGPTKDEESIRALERAFELGVTFYDTADLYGDGHSEALIGESFHNKRDQVLVATKVGYLSWEQEPDFSPQAIRHSVEQSLRRLRTDYIDLLQFHNSPPDLLRKNPDAIEIVIQMKQAGTIRSWSFDAGSDTR